MPFTNYRSQKSQYRQSERLIAKFTCNLAGASGTWLRASGSNQVSNNKVTIGTVNAIFNGVTPGANRFVVSMPRSKLVTLNHARYYPDSASGAVGAQRTLYPLSDLPVDSGGLFNWIFLMVDNAGALALPVLASGLSFGWEISQ